MSLQVFDFKENPVRVVDRENSPWFVAADVCRVLEIGNTTEAIRSLEDFEKMTLSNPEGRAGNGAQSYNLISESGLYALIFKSRKPQAVAFRLWVTSEVLPAIRQNGFYLQSSLDFDRYPVARDFADIFAWLRSMDIGADAAATTARSLVWKNKAPTRKATKTAKSGFNVLEILTTEWQNTVELSGMLNVSKTTFYYHLSEAKKSGHVQTKYGHARLKQ